MTCSPHDYEGQKYTMANRVKNTAVLRTRSSRLEAYSGILMTAIIMALIFFIYFSFVLNTFKRNLKRYMYFYFDNNDVTFDARLST